MHLLPPTHKLEGATLCDASEPLPFSTQGRVDTLWTMQMSPSPMSTQGSTVDDANEPLPHPVAGDTLWTIPMSPSPTST